MRANRRIAATSRSSVSPSTTAGVPARLLQLGKQCASAGFGLVDRGAIVGAVLGQAERLSQPRHRLLAAEQLSRPQDRQHQVQLGLIGRRLAEYVKPVADLDVLDLAQPAVDVQQHVVERVVLGPFCQAEIVVHLGGAHQRPDLLADRGQLAGVERRDVGVLVEQLLQSRDVPVAFGPGHRRDEVVDQCGVRAPLGLGALPRVVDEERVDQRQVAKRRIGTARRGHAERLAGQPLQVAVLAEVDDGVGAESTVQPSVCRQVVMARR